GARPPPVRPRGRPLPLPHAMAGSSAICYPSRPPRVITLPRRLPDARALGDRLAIAAAAFLLLAAYGAAVRQGPALADEFVYLGGARHLAHTGSLAARYYDAS